ncbi:CpsH [Streptococcus pneumoniae]|nr:CpsH [Streptococcus pneumoniae]
MESIFYKKKLITNNKKIINYDFYHPNNILVWEEGKDIKLDEFIQKPYVQLEKDIIDRYSFSNWLSKITEI